jgi:hypothetical protein
MMVAGNWDSCIADGARIEAYPFGFCQTKRQRIYHANLFATCISIALKLGMLILPASLFMIANKPTSLVIYFLVLAHVPF